MPNDQEHPDFHHLTPDAVLHRVEEATGRRLSNLCRPLNSYINRVYEVIEEDGTALIAKFYRPGRWSPDALQDEHDFLLELAEAEIPVIAPLPDTGGRTLMTADQMHFALFPKKGGRICDEPNEDQWRELGRLLARVHLVGQTHEPRDRIHLSPDTSTADQIDFILDSGLVAGECEQEFGDACEDVIDQISPLFEDAEGIRIHGDCHHQNIIHRPGESFYMIDLDDMAVGPPVQDLWMLLPGRVADSRRELHAFLEGYETFREFDDGSLRLVEPLRAMRYIHYTAWCARQAADGGFARLAPDWGSPAYWQQEIRELRKQQVEIDDAQRG
jgi:Ser/Thr protein kinase RdoA (MazF antagonist)